MGEVSLSCGPRLLPLSGPWPAPAPSAQSAPTASLGPVVVASGTVHVAFADGSTETMISMTKRRRYARWWGMTAREVYCAKWAERDLMAILRWVPTA